MHYFIFALALLLAGPASAQTKYSEWSNPDGSAGTPQTQHLIDRLNKLIDEAEKARAADPAFLRDLRDLTRSNPAAASKIILSDDFRDGDFSANPVWSISTGKYWIEKGWGLRSAVTAAVPEQQQQSRSDRNRDAALAILGAVLNKATNNNTATGNTQAPPANAMISTATNIPNAFTIEFDVYSSQADGRLDIGPYQGTNLATGYRLAYTAGAALQIVRTSSRGVNVIASSRTPLSLEDKKTHTIRWTRDRRGTMKVSIDGTAVIDASDTSFNDAFQGLVIDNQGGDYIFRRIVINGAG